MEMIIDHRLPMTRIRIAPELGLWCGVALVIAACEMLGDRLPALHAVPNAVVFPIDAWFSSAIDAVIAPLQPLFRGLSAAVEVPLVVMRDGLQATPWPVTSAAAIAVAWRAGGLKLGALLTFVCAYVLTAGYWPQTMNTLAGIAVAVPIAASIGFGLGVASRRSRLARRMIAFWLDLLQTVPTFAYLIPILVLFGFGSVVGVIASAIYAIAPMAHNTRLGLEAVPTALIEAGQMAGCGKRQLFWQVIVPSAKTKLLLGLNQTILSVFSMVIIAAVIGGSDDVGWALLSTMRQARFGESVVGGLIIAALAISFDRVTLAFADARRGPWPRRVWLAVVAGLGGLAAACFFVAFARSFPAEWRMDFAAPLDDALTVFIARFGATLDAFKTDVVFFCLLPLKVGLSKAVSEFTWGFDLTPPMLVAYWLVVAAGAGVALAFARWRLCVFLGVTAWLLFFGTTGVAWPGFVAAMITLAFCAGGWRTAAFTAAALAFVICAGSYDKMMESLYLCILAVVISLAVGSLSGVAAAYSRHISAVLRPIEDTLQTMPQFVLLIPALMLFQVGEFTALIAIVIYAVVPAARYVEAGLRGVDPELVEAAEQMGASRRQILFGVMLPFALPTIMLGINQTILFAVSMLVIAALVGTRGLALDVYLALSHADAGRGLVAGIAIALVAMVADRIIHAYVAKTHGA